MLRSLLQQKGGTSIAIQHRRKEEYDWKDLDVKLDFPQSRTDFIGFLTSLIR